MQTTNLRTNFFVLFVGCLATAPVAQAESIQAIIRVQQKVTMADLARSVQDPGSSRYRQYYSPEEIRALSAPTDEEYAGLLQQLRIQGIEVMSESPTHLWVTVKGERAALAALDLRAKTAFRSLDFSATRAVISVQGLEPSQKRRPHFVSRSVDAPGAFTGNPPAAIRAFYGFDKIYAAGFTGKGQHIAIATYDDFYLDEVNYYYRDNKILPGPQVDKITFNGEVYPMPVSAGETQVDAEFAGMIAPAAQIHVFTSAQNNDEGELALFTKILDDNRAKIVNYSWGSCESDLVASHKTAMDDVFARAVAQGVNILVASGDSGSSCKGDGTVVADWPAVSPNVVAVGGTKLPADLMGAEVAWSGSGGGFSTNDARPAYQQALPGISSKRGYPDVSFNAAIESGQPAWVETTNLFGGTPSYQVIGGTSIAAPQWSGFLALASEARGGKALGPLNPLLYGMPAAEQAASFHDIVSGSNGAYQAGPGWDAVTGLGALRADVLLRYLQSI